MRDRSAVRIFALLAIIGTAASPAGALTINAQYDANWLNNAPAGAYTDVQNVIQQYDTAYSNPVNVTIQFDLSLIHI